MSTLDLFDTLPHESAADAPERSPSTSASVALEPDASLVPRFLFDYERGNLVLVLDRHTGTIRDYPQNVFETWDWCPPGATVAGEAAHCFRYSNWSASQRWTSEDALRAFLARAAEKQIDLRGMPEKSTFRHRQTAGFVDDSPQKRDKKTGTNDLLAWDHALRVRPRLWISFQRPEHLGEFLDPKQDHRLRAPHEHTRQTAGFAYREHLKDASRELSANGGKYKQSIPGQLAYRSDCCLMVKHRLEQHTSGPDAEVRIVNGVSTFTRANGDVYTLNLATDVLGLVHKKLKGWTFTKETQYVACMMTLVDQEGRRYLNPRTGQPYSFRDIKQYGMVSSGFHMNPGFLRPKFYHHGVKEIAKHSLGTHIIEDENGDPRRVICATPTNLEDAALQRWITATCRIAYEQVIKAMRDFLNSRMDLGVFND